MLGKLPVPGRPTIWITVGQGPAAFVVSADGGCLDIFTLIYPFLFSVSFSLGDARYRLKYCLKGSLNSKQPTDQPPIYSVKAIYMYHFNNKNLSLNVVSQTTYSLYLRPFYLLKKKAFSSFL